MINQEIENLRNKILDQMEKIDQNYHALVDLVGEIRGIHPLDPPSEVKDSLVYGLDFDEAIFFKESLRGWLAADLVLRVWMGDSVATGVGSGRMRIYRDALETVRREGGEMRSVLDQLTRMATALERVEKSDRLKRAQAADKAGRLEVSDHSR